MTEPSSAPIGRLVALIEDLRGENGCPWDKRQTPDSMARYLIEEVHELTDAIAANDADAVCEEAGDVLFQVVFLICMFSESGRFSLRDVIEKNVEKMIRRHPHVFGDTQAETPEAVSQNWEKIKRKEKGERAGRSIMDSIPTSLPALLRAALISERAAKTGFDWADMAGVMNQTMEEWDEFTRELDPSNGQGGNEKAAIEFGDLLFTMVNVARFARIHPETALLRSIQKFEQRFRYMERKAMESERRIDDLSVPEMHILWDDAKNELG